MSGYRECSKDHDEVVLLSSRYLRSLRMSSGHLGISHVIKGVFEI